MRCFPVGCEAFVGQNQIARWCFPICTRGVCRSETKRLAKFPSVNARRFSVGAKIPGGIPQSKCEVIFGQNRNSWRYFLHGVGGVSGQNRNPWPRFPVKTRGVFREGANFLAIFPSLDAWCFSVRTKVPGGFSSVSARRFSVRTEIPGDIYQFECEAFFGQDQNSWRRVPVLMRGVCPPEP